MRPSSRWRARRNRTVEFVPGLGRGMPTPYGINGAGLRETWASTDPPARGVLDPEEVSTMSDTTGRYLSPGVYVEEVDSGARPIEAVGTAVAAFVGLAPAGPGIVVLRAVVLAGLVGVVLSVLRRRSAPR